MTDFPKDKFREAPMMSQHEINIIDNLIEERQVRNVLEWGGGGSTSYFPKRHDCIKQWVSIEHNGRYFKYLENKIDSDKVVMVWVEESEQWYVDSVKLNPPKYDMILIDGLHRNKCLEVAPKLLRDRGFILLHDAYRREYSNIIKNFNNGKKNFLCEGEKPIGDGFFAHRGLLKIEK